ncbi:type II secretion system protein GspN [Desulfoluna sp.]|uniref:type II secretion system protein GspN n=1 Tax=Desulfoluna sp. TaxID=2045199 RepID=UPI0026097272|nr:type II secretion system protein GspN [Desulfoluna sp.]
MKKRLLYTFWIVISLFFFLRVLFPGEFAEVWIESHVDREFGAGSLNVEEVTPALPLGLTVKGLAFKVAELPPLTLRDIRLTPSWLTLFSATPGAEMQASLLGGEAEVDGRFQYEGRQWQHLKGRVADVDLSTLMPFIKGSMPLEISLSGRGDGSLDLSREKKKVEGTGRLSLFDVTVGFKDPIIPVKKLEFASIAVDVEVVGRRLAFSRVHVEGTEVDAELSGTLTLLNRIESSRIDIRGTVNPDPGFVKDLTDRIPLAMLADPKLLKRGRIPLRISGTLEHPKVSFK